MKTVLRFFTITILYTSLATQSTFACYPNDTQWCKKQRRNCCAISTVGAALSIIVKAGCWPTNLSPCQTCIAVWCPYNVPCDNPYNTCGVASQWTSTGCLLLNATQGVLAISPCITENHYKKIRKKICCCCAEDCFCCPEVPELNPDATLR